MWKLLICIVFTTGSGILAAEPPDPFETKLFSMNFVDKLIWIENNVAKNVILLLVEGLDTHTLAAARALNPEAFSRLESAGYQTSFLRTLTKDFWVADPAAASSGIFNGVHEYNGQMGWADQGDANCTQFQPNVNRYPNLFKVMMNEGKITGLVTSGSLTAPGAAGTYASSPDAKLESDIHLREAGCDGKDFKDIASQLAIDYRGLNVIIGKGRQYFQKNTVLDAVTGQVLQDSRSDIDLKAFWAIDKLLKRKTYFQAASKLELSEKIVNSVATYENILGLFGELENNFFYTGIASAVRAIESNRKKNFFLTLHADLLSKAHDRNDVMAVAKELLSLMDILNYEIARASGTLVLIAPLTGSTMTMANEVPRYEDMTTGERLLGNCQTAPWFSYSDGINQEDEVNVTSTSSVYPSKYPGRGSGGGSDLPVMASGPGAYMFRGTMSYPDIYHRILYVTCSGSWKKVNPRCQSSTTPPPPPRSTTTPTPPRTTSTTKTTQAPPITPRPTTAAPTQRPATTRPMMTPSPNWPWPFPRPVIQAPRNPYAWHQQQLQQRWQEQMKLKQQQQQQQQEQQRRQQQQQNGVNPYLWASMMPFFF